MKKIILYILLIVSVNTNAQKYILGIQSGSSNNPVSDSIYKIVCAGNSLTYGTPFNPSSDSCYPNQMAVYFPNSTILNIGIGGYTTHEMEYYYYSVEDLLYSPDTVSILMGWEIGNNLWGGAYPWTPDSTYEQTKRYCQYGQGSGYRVVVGTAPYRYFTGNNPAGHDSAYFNRQCDTVNNLIRANYTLWADAIVNFDQDARINGLDLTYRDGDGIHYTGVGYRVIAEMIKTQIFTL